MTGGAVSLLLSQPSAETRRSDRKSAQLGWMPAFELATSQGPSSSSRVAWPVRDHENVALPYGHPFAALRHLQVAGEDAVAGLEPTHPPRARGMSSSTPRPISPSLRSSTVSTAAPVAETESAGLPL